MAYGTVKVDNITFDNGGSDQNVTVSGLYRATTSGVTVTGTISGAVLVGTTTVSGATVTGNVVQGTTVQGISGTFTSLTGTTTTGTTANFASGVFTTRVSGTIITGDTGQFTSGTFVSLTGTTITGTTINAVTVSSTTGTFTSLTGTTITGTTINGVTVAATTGSFTSLTGTTTSGTTANFVSGVFTTQISGATVTGTTANFTSGNFTSISGGTQTVTSGVFAAGSATNPSISFASDTNTGIYSPGADQVAISTNGTGRLFVDASGNVGVGGSSNAKLQVNSGDIRIIQTDNTANNGLYFRNAVDSATFAKVAYKAATGELEVGTTDAYSLLLLSNNAERARIDSSGRVGIGTTSPTARLDLGAPGNAIFFQASNGVDSTLRFTFASNLTTIGNAGGVAGLALETGGSERARIDSSGRLLVGTSTASTALGALTAKMQVQGTSVFDTGIINALWESSANPPQLQLVKSRGASIGTHTVVQNNDVLGRITFGGSDGTDFEYSAWIQSEVDGTPGTNDMPGRLVFSTTADGAASPTERLRITSAGVLQVADAGNIQVGTTTGTKIGTATTQKIGFFDKTPVVQPTAVADATDAASAITQLNALLTRMRNLGLIAT